jgi:hypothetical protein
METHDDATVELPVLEVVDYVQFIIESEPLIIKLQELQAAERLQPELRQPWERFNAFLESPEPGPTEEAQGPLGGEPTDNPQASLAETRSEPAGNLVDSAAVALASNYYCCILRRYGASTIRRTYDTNRYIATAKCRQLELASRPPRRTMTYPLPNRRC